MSKEELKRALAEAIRKGPHSEDIQSVAVFGSHVRGTQTDESDVDVLIDFAPEAKVGYFKLAHIQRHLQACLGRPVDLLTPEAISGFFRDEVLRQAEYVFER